LDILLKQLLHSGRIVWGISPKQSVHQLAASPAHSPECEKEETTHARRIASINGAEKADAMVRSADMALRIGRISMSEVQGFDTAADKGFAGRREIGCFSEEMAIKINRRGHQLRL
jgi:hypothetical protein